MESAIEPLGSEALRISQTYKIGHLKKIRVSIREFHNQTIRDSDTEKRKREEAIKDKNPITYLRIEWPIK